MLYAIVAMLAVILDQWVKYWVSIHLTVNTDIIRLIPGVLSIVNVHNDGAAFSMLAGGGARIWFILIAGAFTVLVIIALATNMISKPLGRWSAVMVAAGGIANAIDRMLYGYVQDMFKVELFNFAVFNVADIFITVFCILFILYIIFGTRGSGEDEDEEDEEEEEVEEPVEEAPKPKRRARKAAAEAEAEEEPQKAPKAKRVKEAREEPEAKPEVTREATIVMNRKARQAQYEDEYEQYKAAKAQRKPLPKAEPVVKQPKAEAVEDPFAEWEKVTARQEQERKQTAESFAPAAAPVEKPAAPKAAPAPAPKPAAKKPAPKKLVEEDEFDLDSILNEFK